MTQREIDLKTIIQEFSIWEVNLGNHNSLNYLDGNLISEYTICEILNSMFGYELKSANVIKNNHAAIDLRDEVNRISVQVTSSNSVKKIRETLKKYVELNLQEDFDELFIVILGKKQKSYPSLKIPPELSFDASKNILDFKGLLQIINFLPATKLSQLKNILSANAVKKEKSGLNRAAELLKKTLAMRKRFYKDFIDTKSQRDWDPSYYTPRIDFNFHSVILRDVGDRTFPVGDPENMKWIKCEFSDMYEYGVEFARQAGYLLVDQQGYWDKLDSPDPRLGNPLYAKVSAWVFYRLAFENMVTYELESDGYYGYPTIFCHFKHDGWPFEEVKFGRLGDPDAWNGAYYYEDTMHKRLP